MHPSFLYLLATFNSPPKKTSFIIIIIIITISCLYIQSMRGSSWLSARPTSTDPPLTDLS